MTPARRRLLPAVLAALAALGAGAPGRAAAEELTLYSGRHYDTDDKLFAHFTKLTGIQVKRVEGKEEEILERLRQEGAASPADVFITTDAARLGQAEALGLFAPVESAVLASRIPASLRTATWFSFSKRARIVVFDRTRLKAAEVATYEDLASPRLKGKLCVRSGSHPYNLSLGSALIAHRGEAATEAWARGVVANLARPPRGGDTDQLRAIGAGECQVALVNSYYLARLLRSARAEDREIARRVAVSWPDQATFGTHVNVSGGGVLRTAPHREAAVKFLEYLAGDQAQAYFAEANSEWPVVKTAKVRTASLGGGDFKEDALPVETLSRNAAKAREIFERAGWR